MKVFGYCRVSTVEQATSGDSLATQRTQIAGYCMMKTWEPAGIFVDAGVSGSIPFAEREEGGKLLAALHKGDVVVTPKLDRMFRSASDALATLEEMKDQGIGLHMLDLGGDVTGNGISKLVFTILSAVAEQERDRLRTRIREVKQHLARQGVYGGGKRPFGFDIVDGKLVRNDAEQAVISDMKTRHQAGQSYNEIARLHGTFPTNVKRLVNRTTLA